MAGIPCPVLFIHGFDGTPADWTEDGFPLYLVREGGFDPDLIRLFYYGLDGEGHYNNRGDCRQIAARLMGQASRRPEDLASQVGTLSRDSLAKGGPAGVNIVAHSMGGLIARYYLSRRTPDEYGTVYQGDVARLIAIGTPHQGVALTKIVGLLSDSGSWLHLLRQVERLPLFNPRASEALQQADDAIRWWQQEARRPYLRQVEAQEVDRLASPALRQMQPGSVFLNELNAPGAMPTEVAYYNLYGDIRVISTVTLASLSLYRQAISLGDLLVSVESARHLPNAKARAYAFPYTQRWSLSLWGGDARYQVQPWHKALPPSYHGNLRRHPGVQAQVLHLIRKG